jgi:hypothetical protein
VGQVTYSSQAQNLSEKQNIQLLGYIIFNVLLFLINKIKAKNPNKQNITILSNDRLSNCAGLNHNKV